MLDTAIEKVLALALEPYLDGIRIGSLRDGIFKGHLELRDLSLKPEVLALAGLEGFRIRKGTVKLIGIRIPWNSLATGKVAVVVSGVHLAVEQVPDSRSQEEIVASMREMKEKAVEIRATQVRDLMEQRRKAAQSMEGEEEGFGMKLARKFINNVTVEISDVQVSFASTILGVAAGTKLPQLLVLSTDENFVEPKDGRTVSITGSAMYKVVQIRGFDVQLCTGNGCGLDNLEDAPRIFGPFDTILNFAHVPKKKQIQVGLSVGNNKVTLTRSHLKHLMGVPPILEADLARTRARLVAPNLEKAILEDPDICKELYGRFYSRKIAHQRFNDAESPDLSEEEEKKMQVLQDVLPVNVLAAQRCSAENAVEEAATSGPIREQDGFFAAFLRRVTCCTAGDRSSVRFAALRDATQFESVEVPQNFAVDVNLGEANFHLVDDRGVVDESRQVASLSLRKTKIGFQLGLGVDHRGSHSVAFRLEGCFDGISAHHAGKDIIRVIAPTAESDFTGASKWIVEQTLEADHNLVSVSFDSNPLDISFYPAMVAQLMDMFKPADLDPLSPSRSIAVLAGEIDEVAAEILAVVNSAEVAVEKAAAAKEKATQWTEGVNAENAQDLANSVYHHVPEKIFLRLNLSGPVVHLPVLGLGMVDVSLGQLRLTTPFPGEMSNIKVVAELSNASLRTVSSSSECIDVIKPFPLRLSLEQSETADVVKVNAEVSMGRLELCAAPQALQIMAAIPQVLEELQPVLEEAQPAQAAEAAGSPRSEDTAQKPQEETVANLSGSEQVDKSPRGLDAAARRAKEVAKKQLCVAVAAQLAGIGLSVTDYVVPVARVQLQFLEPGILLHAEMSLSGVLDHAHLDVQNAALDAEVLNPHNGAWEPVLEPFHFGADVEVTGTGGDDLATHLSCRGRTPLLVNAALPAVQRLNGLAPLVSSALEPRKGGGDRGKVPGRYRVINLFDSELELVFASPSASQVTSRINPASSDWTSMDELIFPTLAKTVAVRLPGGESSMPLRLDQGGVVCVPGSQATAELLTPEASCRLLLLGTPLRIHNQTDVPLEVRFHDERHEVIPYGLPQAVTCNASWVGFPLPSYIVDDHLRLMQDSHERGPQDGSFLLQPNTICAVPPAALQSSEAGGLFARVSTRPVGLDMDFSAEVEVGGAEGLSTLSCAAANRKPKTLLGSGPQTPEEKSAPKAAGWLKGCGMCSSKAGQPERLNKLSCSQVHLACECKRRSVAAPAELCMSMVALKPAMFLLNALPVGSLSVGYTAGHVDAASSARWQEVQVRSMSCLNLYQFPVGALSNGISVRVRLDAGAPWSHPVYFRADALEKPGSAHTLDVRQSKDGAAAGLGIESLGSLRLRLHCPNYFIHRLALGKDMELALHHKGAALPHAKEVTLLPSHLENNTCEIVLKSCGERVSHGLPLEGSFSIGSRKTHKVLCTHVEDVDPSSLLGAWSRVLTVKAHMVLTNTSAEDLQLQAPDGSVVALPASTSAEHHFHVEHHFLQDHHIHGENGKALETTLRLRTAKGAAGQWSLPVHCCESAAGATPVSLPAAQPGASGPEVWTVEVAPEGSAVSVSFRKGSDLVVINRATRAGVPLTIWPDSEPKYEGIVVQPGEELPIGWAKPRQGSEKRPVAVAAAGVAVKIEDVRRRTRRVLGSQQLAVTVSRIGTRTLLVLEDIIGESAKMSGKTDVEGGSSLHVDLRLDEIGLSIVGRPSQLARPHELFYFHLGNIRLDYQQNVSADSALVNLVISELQGACQLPDRHDSDENWDNCSPLPSSEAKRKPAVILANRGEDGAAFLCISLQQEAVSSQDLILSSANIALDHLDVSVDGGWLGPLQEWVTEAFPQDDLGSGVRFEQIASRAGRDICEGYTPPPVPLVLSSETLQLSAVKAKVWCRVPLSLLDFLPAPARGALAVLSLSGSFTLDGAGIHLPAKSIPPYSGPVDQFSIKLARSYGWGLLRVVGELLGKSSLLNIPKSPFLVVGTTLTVLTNGVGAAISQGTSALTHMGLATEEAERHRQRQEQKQIGHVGDGVTTAGSSLARGVVGLGDIVRKPIEGAQQDGLKGFAKGIGTGIVGTLVKPIAAIGEAATDVGAGFGKAKAQLLESKATKRRRGLHRYRDPRLLYSELGEMRMWNEHEAEVPRQLGWEITRGVKEVVYLTVEGSSALAMLLFPEKLLLAKLSVEAGGEAEGSGAREEGAGRLEEEFGAALRPFSSLEEAGAFKGFQQQHRSRTFLQQLQGEQEHNGPAEPDLSASVRGLQLGDLHSVELEEAASAGSTAAATRKLVLEDITGAVTRLSLGGGLACSVEESAVRCALLAGLREAAAGGQAEWSALGAALRSRTLALRLTEQHEASSQLLEVFEVERWHAIASEWKVPYLPIDRALSWRWVNAKGSRHPQIETSMPKKECAAAERPPCELRGFQAASEWEVGTDQHTDEHGWTYSHTWTGAWDVGPGKVKGLRRRRWSRRYA